MPTVAPAGFAARAGPPGFAARHPADFWFFPSIVAVMWLILLGGFVPEIIERAGGDARPYPLVIHAHAVVFFGWMVFLTSQMVLVRTGNIAWHRRMGLVGVGMATAVVVFGPAAALTMQMDHLARQPPQFLAIQLLNILAFGGMIAAGLWLRNQPAVHKRLMLIGTAALIGAGFGRIVRMVTGSPPPFTLLPSVYIAGNILILAIAIHDYRTRGRLHPVFVAAVVVLVAVELCAGLLLRSPAWIGFTRALVA